MRKIPLLLFLNIIATTCLLAQTDSIQINSLPKGDEFITYRRGIIWQSNHPLNKNDVRSLMQNDTEALRLYNTGKRLQGTAFVFGFAGGFSLGACVGSYLGSGNKLDDNKKKTLKILAISGCVELGIGLLFDYLGNNKIKQSVKLYNTKNQRNQTSYYLDFGLTPTGVGLSLRF